MVNQVDGSLSQSQSSIQVMRNIQDKKLCGCPVSHSTYITEYVGDTYDKLKSAIESDDLQNFNKVIKKAKIEDCIDGIPLIVYVIQEKKTNLINKIVSMGTSEHVEVFEQLTDNQIAELIQHDYRASCIDMKYLYKKNKYDLFKLAARRARYDTYDEEGMTIVRIVLHRIKYLELLIDYMDLFFVDYGRNSQLSYLINSNYKCAWMALMKTKKIKGDDNLRCALAFIDAINYGIDETKLYEFIKQAIVKGFNPEIAIDVNDLYKVYKQESSNRNVIFKTSFYRICISHGYTRVSEYLLSRRPQMTKENLAYDLCLETIFAQNDSVIDANLKIINEVYDYTNKRLRLNFGPLEMWTYSHDEYKKAKKTLLNGFTGLSSECKVCSRHKAINTTLQIVAHMYVGNEAQALELYYDMQDDCSTEYFVELAFVLFGSTRFIDFIHEYMCVLQLCEDSNNNDLLIKQWPHLYNICKAFNIAEFMNIKKIEKKIKVEHTTDYYADIIDNSQNETDIGSDDDSNETDELYESKNDNNYEQRIVPTEFTKIINNNIQEIPLFYKFLKYFTKNSISAHYMRIYNMVYNDNCIIAEDNGIVSIENDEYTINVKTINNERQQQQYNKRLYKYLGRNIIKTDNFHTFSYKFETIMHKLDGQTQNNFTCLNGKQGTFIGYSGKYTNKLTGQVTNGIYEFIIQDDICIHRFFNPTINS